MRRVLSLHSAAAEIVLRLFLLHLLWILHTLRGGVVLGLFPATAAVHAVLRRDAMSRDHARADLWREFGTVWRSELGRANALGWALAAVWTVLVVQHSILTATPPSGLAAGVAGALGIGMAVLGVVTTLTWVLHAHFEESVPALLRRSVTLALGRPLVALGCAAGVAVVLCLYYVLPGLVPVLGTSLPALVAVTTLWGSGVLPRPPSTRVPTRETVSP